MLEVVQGGSYTGTVKRYLGLQLWVVKEFAFPCIMLYRCCIERENVDIGFDLCPLTYFGTIQSFLLCDKGVVPPIKIPLNCTV